VTVREGFHAIDAVAEFFAAADLVALPYRLVSQSGVLQLAYGFSRPVVAYPVGGLTEAVIDGETGWLCRQPTPSALAAALHEADAAGRDELRRRGAAGRRWASETLDWDAIAAATEAVYATVTRG
jgi:D-inositol-3-phosphate glycosyltransferase